MPDHVLGDRGLRHRDSNLQQFSANAGSSPARVGEAHFPDQIANFWRYTRSSCKMATLPISIQSKPLLMPGDDSLRLDKEQCRAPIVPQSRKPDPQDTVSPTETQPTPHRSNVARLEAGAGGQESQLAEQRELGNNLAERRVRSAWSGKATGRDSVNATISMGMDFLVGTGRSGILQALCQPRVAECAWL
jgi:hypothetical protein